MCGFSGTPISLHNDIRHHRWVVYVCNMGPDLFKIIDFDNNGASLSMCPLITHRWPMLQAWPPLFSSQPSNLSSPPPPPDLLQVDPPSWRVLSGYNYDYASAIACVSAQPIDIITIDVSA